MILSILQTKGGTGKTTLAKCLAYSKTFAKAFNSICLMELDPQGTIKAWHDQRTASKDKVTFIELLEKNENKLKVKLETLNEEHNALILDVPGESTGKIATRVGSVVSDIVLLPMRTSTNDEQSFADNLLPILEKIMEVDPEKIGAFHIIPTFVHPQANPNNINSYFTEIMPDTIKCLKYVLPTRCVYENFSREGATLYDYAEMVKNNIRHSEQAKRAIKDIETIAKEILSLTNKKHAA